MASKKARIAAIQKELYTNKVLYLLALTPLIILILFRYVRFTVCKLHFAIISPCAES